LLQAERIRLEYLNKGTQRSEFRAVFVRPGRVRAAGNQAGKIVIGGER
jgi:hypothetical protein